MLSGKDRFPMVILLFIAIVFGLAILAIVVLLALPISVHGCAESRSGRESLRITVSFFFGLLSKTIVDTYSHHPILPAPYRKVDVQANMSGFARKVIYYIQGRSGESRAGTAVRLVAVIRRFFPYAAGLVHHALGKPGYECRKLKVEIEIGTGSPMLSAIAVGSTYAGLGALMPVAIQYGRLCRTKPEIRIRPRFDDEAFYAGFECIFAISLGYIMLRELAIRVGSLLRGSEVNADA